jgi:structural maintenance of chromosome 3 (chondroitin sulfate proteoglycan 6)
MDTASTVSKKHNIDTITLDGDQVSKRGALTGGFIDKKRSKLKFFDELKQAKARHAEILVEQKRAKEAAQSIIPPHTILCLPLIVLHTYVHWLMLM